MSSSDSLIDLMELSSSSEDDIPVFAPVYRPSLTKIDEASEEKLELSTIDIPLRSVNLNDVLQSPRATIDGRTVSLEINHEKPENFDKKAGYF